MLDRPLRFHVGYDNVEQRRGRVAAGTRWEALYRVLLSLGLRRGEVLGLLWADVDLDSATLRITGALQRVEGKRQRTTPKTARSAATLPLPATLVEVLRQHAERQRVVRGRKGEQWEEHGLVFPSGRGTPMEPGNLNRHFGKLLKRLKLPRLRVHDLRHTCAAFLIAQNVHPKVIQTILRHTNISTTMDVYGHVFDAQQREAADGLADLLDGKADKRTS